MSATHLTKNIRSMWIVTAITFVAALPRILSLYLQIVHHDEVWSIFQTVGGTPAQISAWLPYDWPPLHYLLLGGWEALVGIHPLAVRMSSVLISLLGVPLMYRIVRRVSRNEAAALAAALLYATLPFMVFMGILARGYGLLITLTLFGLWFTIRYFHRPTMIRAALLAVVMAAMFYTHLTAVLGFGVFGIYALIAAPRQLWRWWLPGVIAVPLALPEILNKASLALSRIAATQQYTVLPPLHAFAALFDEWMIGAWLPWLALVVVALVGVALTSRRGNRRALLFFGAWALLPVPLYFTNPVHGFFNSRALAFCLIGVSGIVGIGLAALPRRVTYGAAAALLILGASVQPGNTIYLQTEQYPFDLVFAGLRRAVQTGDVLLIDPELISPHPEEWDYYTRVYFPEGIRFVAEPGEYRRVWYVSIDGIRDAATYAAVQDGRVASTFFGPWNFLARLYEGAPDRQGVAYANGLRFHGAEIINATDNSYAVFREGETVRARGWWSVDTPPERDYSLGVFILGDSGVISEFNGGLPAIDAPTETSQWLPGRYYITEFDLPLPDPTRTGWYPMRQTVYQWWDGARVAVESGDADDLLTIARLFVKSW